MPGSLLANFLRVLPFFWQFNKIMKKMLPELKLSWEKKENNPCLDEITPISKNKNSHITHIEATKWKELSAPTVDPGKTTVTPRDWFQAKQSVPFDGHWTVPCVRGAPPEFKFSKIGYNFSNFHTIGYVKTWPGRSWFASGCFRILVFYTGLYILFWGFHKWQLQIYMEFGKIILVGQIWLCWSRVWPN